MQNNIRNTNLRFNLDKDQQRRAWEYLQTMDRQDFKSYSQVISLALVPSSVGQDRIILLPGNEITKARNMRHYDKIYRKTNSYNTKQRASV